MQRGRLEAGGRDGGMQEAHCLDAVSKHQNAGRVAGALTGLLHPTSSEVTPICNARGQLDVIFKGHQC